MHWLNAGVDHLNSVESQSPAAIPQKLHIFNQIETVLEGALERNKKWIEG